MGFVKAGRSLIGYRKSNPSKIFLARQIKELPFLKDEFDKFVFCIEDEPSIVYFYDKNDNNCDFVFFNNVKQVIKLYNEQGND